MNYHHIFKSFLAIFLMSVVLNLVSACLPPSRDLDAHDFPIYLIRVASIAFMQKLTSVFIFSSFSVISPGAASPRQAFLPFKRGVLYVTSTTQFYHASELVLISFSGKISFAPFRF